MDKATSLYSTSKWVVQNSIFNKNFVHAPDKEDDTMPTTCRHVDVSHLTDDECRQIIDVISKDILLRKSEKERMTRNNKQFEDFRKSVILANTYRKKRQFDDYCLICGKHLFTFICLLNLGEECISCEHLCCSSCRKTLVLQGDGWMDKCYMCYLCFYRRDWKQKNFEWFHEIVDKKFKRFGSAKILRAIYKQKLEIEPRVITLLAHCRELQPTRTFSITSMRKASQGVSYSKDNNKLTYSSSLSDVLNGDVTECEKSEKFTNFSRKRFMSESELSKLQLEPTRQHSQSASRPFQRSISAKDIRDNRKCETSNVGTFRSNGDNLYSKKDDAPLSVDDKTPMPVITGRSYKKLASQPLSDSFQGVITEDKDEEEVELDNLVMSKKVEYIGWTSLTLTICVVMVILFNMIGCVCEICQHSLTDDAAEDDL